MYKNENNILIIRFPNEKMIFFFQISLDDNKISFILSLSHLHTLSQHIFVFQRSLNNLPHTQFR